MTLSHPAKIPSGWRDGVPTCTLIETIRDPEKPRNILLYKSSVPTWLYACQFPWLLLDTLHQAITELDRYLDVCPSLCASNCLFDGLAACSKNHATDGRLYAYLLGRSSEI